MKRVLFVGHGQHGKDTACEELARATGWRNAGTTSVYLADHVAKRLGVTRDEAYARRYENRALWRHIGDEIRGSDPALLVKDAQRVGPITGGCRGLPEIVAVRAESLTDLIVWIDASGRLGPDETMEFGPEYADIVITNNGSEDEFRQKIQRLGAALL